MYVHISHAFLKDLNYFIPDVRHRHLTSDWFLRYINLTDMNSRSQHHFPCHSVVMAKVTLRPGEGKMYVLNDGLKRGEQVVSRSFMLQVLTHSRPYMLQVFTHSRPYMLQVLTHSRLYMLQVLTH